MKQSGIEPATFLFVAQCLNKLCHFTECYCVSTDIYPNLSIQYTRNSHPLQLRISTHQKRAKYFFFLQFSGPRHWYFLMHESHDFQENVDCPIATYSSPACDISLITNHAYNNFLVQNIHRLFTAICGGKSR